MSDTIPLSSTGPIVEIFNRLDAIDELNVADNFKKLEDLKIDDRLEILEKYGIYKTLTDLKNAKSSVDLPYTLLTALGRVEYSYIEGDFTGKTDNLNVIKLERVSISQGALVRQNSTNIAYDSKSSVRDKLDFFALVTDSRFKGGAKGDGVSDDSEAVQAAINFVEEAGGGYVDFPRGTYRCNIVAGHRVKLRGVGRVCATLVSAKALPVFRLPVNKSVTRIGIEDLYLKGDHSHTDCDVINLQPSGDGTFVDDILILNCLIENGGRDGIFAEGIKSSGPFVQRLKISNCEVRANRGNGIRLRGTVLESIIDNTSVSRPQGTPGSAGSGISLETNGDHPLRVNMTGLTIDNYALVQAGKPAFGLYIGAGANISISSSNFEFCSPAIATGDSPFSHGFTVKDTNFGFGENVADVILLRKARMVSIRNCTFRVAAGHSITNIVRLDGSMSDLRRIDFSENTYQGTISNICKDENSFYQVISSGSINKWRSTITVLGEGASPFVDDLENIFGDNGESNAFVSGETVTILPFNNFENVTVKHGVGNLLLSGKSDYKLDSLEKNITFTWNSSISKWIETSRS